MQKTSRECLVIDDDQDDQEIFAMCLHAVDSSVVCRTAGDPVEAIALLGSETSYTPDYIFIDVNMPKMNGLDCLQVLQSMGRLAYTKMFMYSTSAETGVLEESQKRGAEDYIIKPAKTRELKEKLTTIFEIVSEINK